LQLVLEGLLRRHAPETREVAAVDLDARVAEILATLG
jgi:hypothetical protein